MAASPSPSSRSAPRPQLRVLRRTSCVRQTCSTPARPASAQPGHYFASAQQQRRERHERHERRQRALGHAAHARPRRTSALATARPVSCPGETRLLSPSLAPTPRTSPPPAGGRSFRGSVDLLAAIASAELSPHPHRRPPPAVPAVSDAQAEPSALPPTAASPTVSPPPLIADSSDSPLEPALPTPTSNLSELPALETLPPSLEPHRAHWEYSQAPPSYVTGPPPRAPLRPPPRPVPTRDYYSGDRYDAYYCSPPQSHRPSHPPAHLPPPPRPPRHHGAGYRSPRSEYYGFAPPHAQAVVGINQQPVYAMPESEYRPWYPAGAEYASASQHPLYSAYEQPTVKPHEYRRPASYWGPAQAW